MDKGTSLVSILDQVSWGMLKGQLISKADWRAIDSPKKWTDEFVLFAFLLFTAKESNLAVCFLGESTARQSAFRFHLTFTSLPPAHMSYPYPPDFQAFLRTCYIIDGI